MKFVKRLYYAYLKRKNPIKYARKIGVVVGNNCRLLGMPKYGPTPYLIKIGNHVSISSGCVFINHEGAHWVLKNMCPEKFNLTFGYGRIEIKDNVYIGQNVTILRGVTIGENTVIGACSLVNKSCMDNSVYAGIPAKRICSIEEFGKKFLEDMPEFDLINYQKNRQDEIQRIVDKFRKR